MHDWYEAGDAALALLRRDLVECGLIAPVAPDLGAHRRWLAHELASMVELCLGLEVDPEELDEAEKVRWAERLRAHYLPPRADPQGTFAGRFWILEDQRPVGIVALDLRAYGRTWQELGSLYVRREARGRGIASRLLASVAAAAVTHGLAGLRLAADASWKKSLRWLLSRGMWAVSWLHDVRLTLEPGLPEWRTQIDGDRARLEVLVDGVWRSVCEATREGDQLVPAALGPVSPARSELFEHAIPTFAVALALHEWPFIRSHDAWRANAPYEAGRSTPSSAR